MRSIEMSMSTAETEEYAARPGDNEAGKPREPNEDEKQHLGLLENTKTKQHRDHEENSQAA
jgi:hypothetical protein